MTDTALKTIKPEFFEAAWADYRRLTAGKKRIGRLSADKQRALRTRAAAINGITLEQFEQWIEDRAAVAVAGTRSK